MSRPLRIGLNLVYLAEDSGGAGTYARELIPALLEAEPGTRIVAFVGRSAPADIVGAPWASEVEWVTFPLEYGYESPWNPLRARRSNAHSCARSAHAGYAGGGPATRP